MTDIAAAINANMDTHGLGDFWRSHYPAAKREEFGAELLWVMRWIVTAAKEYEQSQETTT